MPLSFGTVFDCAPHVLPAVSAVSAQYRRLAEAYDGLADSEDQVARNLKTSN
jgi:hypothetical protein